MKKSIILLIAALLMGLFGYLKPGLNIVYASDVKANIVSVESSKTGNRKATRIGKTNGVRHYYVTFKYNDENGFEQEVTQKVSVKMYNYYRELSENEERSYHLYRADIDTDNDVASGYYLTEKSGEKAVWEYKSSHNLFIHKLAQMLCIICLLCSGFLMWLSSGRKKSAKPGKDNTIQN